MSRTENVKLVRTLIAVLENQVAAARCGKVGIIEETAGQLDSVSREVGRAGLLDDPKLRQSRDRIMELYNELRLTLSAQRDELAEQIRLVHKGRKTLRAYRQNI